MEDSIQILGTNFGALASRLTSVSNSYQESKECERLWLRVTKSY